MKKHLLNILSIMSLLTFFAACSKVSDEDLRAAHIAAQNGAVIVDVRTPEEFAQNHVQNAINIPVEKIERLYYIIPKSKEIIVYCKSGSRSHVAAVFLQKKGRKVYDVATQKDWQREIPAAIK